jgi:hypothetical protein
VAWHPYAYIFRNQSVEWLPGGREGFQGDYLGLSYREAARWFSPRVAGQPNRVLAFDSSFDGVDLYEYFADEGSEVAHFPSDFLERGMHPQELDFVVMLEWMENPAMIHGVAVGQILTGAQVIHEVGVGDLTLLRIWQYSHSAVQLARGHPHSSQPVTPQP